MAKHNGDAVWIEIDITTLTSEQLEAYTAYKALYKDMKAQRQAFEASMAVGVPEGQRMIFGYNFGKLSISVVADDRKATKPKQAQMSLAQYLATRQAAGLAN